MFGVASGAAAAVESTVGPHDQITPPKLEARRMKILIFAHSGASGGAENALRHLVGLLAPRHEVHVVLPTTDGSEAAYYMSRGIGCFHLPMPWALPHFSTALLQYSGFDFAQIAEALRGHGFDIAISNTLAILHGGLIAALLGIPHLTYAHELLEDPELLPTSLPAPSYLKIVEDLSSAIISCSHSVSQQFRPEKRASLAAMAPFDFDQPALPRAPISAPENVLQVIGTQSRRKNVGFAVTVVKALGLRGIDVRLDIVGSPGVGGNTLTRTLQKRRIPFRMVPHCPDPCAVNLTAKAVTLVCATSEPYGLTVPESLRFGVPVLATRSGGPTEMLPDAFLFDVNDLDGCVRKLEQVFGTYPEAVTASEAIYRQLQAQSPAKALRDGLDAVLASAVTGFAPAGETPVHDWIASLRSVSDPGIGLSEIATNIATVQGTGAAGMAEVLAAIAADKAQPGSATGADIRAFDVVPYADSKQMEALYTRGLGLAIELASTYDDPGRLQMAAFILCALNDLQRSLARPIKVLALGDGIGIDTLRLARAGFSVDYMDYDKSAMSAIAALNLAAAQAACPGLDITVVERVTREYDAVVCLEVIEHVPSPSSFADVLFGALTENGRLFISECFNGIEARWPTHLLPNERLSGLLPVVLHDHFAYLGANRAPYAKPYMLSRRSAKLNAKPLDLLLDPTVMTYLVLNQSDIGV